MPKTCQCLTTLEQNLWCASQNAPLIILILVVKSESTLRSAWDECMIHQIRSPLAWKKLTRCRHPYCQTSWTSEADVSWLCTLFNINLLILNSVQLERWRQSQTAWQRYNVCWYCVLTFAKTCYNDFFFKKVEEPVEEKIVRSENSL